MVIREDQPSAPRDSVKPRLTQQPITPRALDPRAAALEWVEDMKRGDVEAVARDLQLVRGPSLARIEDLDGVRPGA